MKFIISGGGTGGHIFPAVAIANEMRRRQPDAGYSIRGRQRPHGDDARARSRLCISWAWTSPACSAASRRKICCFRCGYFGRCARPES
ncbi:MAG: glycosyltransferase [Hymenobacter sp.]